MAFSIEYNPDEQTAFIYEGVGEKRQLIRQIGNASIGLDADKIYVVVNEVGGSTTRKAAEVPVANSITLYNYVDPLV